MVDSGPADSTLELPEQGIARRRRNYRPQSDHGREVDDGRVGHDLGDHVGGNGDTGHYIGPQGRPGVAGEDHEAGYRRSQALGCEAFIIGYEFVSKGGPPLRSMSHGWNQSSDVE